MAAREGYLKVLQWLRKHACPWDETTCKEAAVHGKLATLRWAYKNGCPCDMRDCWDDPGSIGGALRC